MSKTISSNQFLNFLTIIFFGLVVGQIVLAVVAYFLINKNIVKGSNELEQLLFFSIPSFILFSFFGGNFIYKNLLNKINFEDEINLKQKTYFKALIFKYGLLESGGIFAFVAVILTGNYVFLIFSGIVILLFIYNKPTQAKLIKDLKLNESDIFNFNETSI